MLTRIVPHDARIDFAEHILMFMSIVRSSVLAARFGQFREMRTSGILKHAEGEKGSARVAPRFTLG